MPIFLQITGYVISTCVTILALWVAYLTLLSRSQPMVLVYYRPNPTSSTIIDLVIENVGGGNAIDIQFSKSLPIKCNGLKKLSGEPSYILGSGIPIMYPGQKYVYDGGQYGGLYEVIGNGLEVNLKYKYKTPIGYFAKKVVERFIVVDHLARMSARKSSDEAIVNAFEGRNNSTLKSIVNELSNINDRLDKINEK